MQQRIDLLTLHTTAVHGAQTGSRLEKLPRPVFTLNMTEAAWDFKVIVWDSYIQQTPVLDNAKLLLQGRGGQTDHHQRDVQPRHLSSNLPIVIYIIFQT